MKKLVLSVTGLVALVCCRLYVGSEPDVAPSPVAAESSGELHGGIADNVALKVAVRLGLDAEEAKAEIPKTQKIQRAANRAAEAFAAEMAKPLAKAAAVQEPAPEPTPDPISTEIVVEEPEEPKNEYLRARSRAEKSGKPLLLYITGDRCGPCNLMKANTINPLKDSGAFDDFEYVEMNRDHDGRALFISGALGVPQLVYYTPDNQFNSGRRLIGNRSKDEVLSFLKGGQK